MQKSRNCSSFNSKQNRDILPGKGPHNAKQQLKFLNNDLDNKTRSSKCLSVSRFDVTALNRSSAAVEVTKNRNALHLLEINNTLLDGVNLTGSPNRRCTKEDIPKRDNDNKSFQIDNEKEDFNYAFVERQKRIIPRRKLLSQQMSSLKSIEQDYKTAPKKRHSDSPKAACSKKICVSNVVLDNKDLNYVQDNENSSSQILLNYVKKRDTGKISRPNKNHTRKYRSPRQRNKNEPEIASENNPLNQNLAEISKIYQNDSPEIFSEDEFDEDQWKNINMTTNNATDYSMSQNVALNDVFERKVQPEETLFKDMLESSIFSQDIDIDSIIKEENNKFSLTKKENCKSTNIEAPDIVPEIEYLNDNYEMSQLFKSSQLSKILSGIKNTQNSPFKSIPDKLITIEKEYKENENRQIEELFEKSDLPCIFDLSNIPVAVDLANETFENINDNINDSISINQQVDNVEFVQTNHNDNMYKNMLPGNNFEFSDLHKSMHKQNEENVNLNEAVTDLEKQELLSQMYKSSQYRKEIQAVFDVCEISICQNNGTEDNTKNDTMGLAALQNVNWENDSFMNNAIERECRDVSVDILNGLKQRLINNAKLDIVPKTLVHQITQIPMAPNIPVPKPTYFSLGPYYGLPKKCQELIREYKGINKLYDWQNECLNLPAVNQRKNLIYALPTSGGKTLVAEILILREIICRKKNVIFILPFVSIVQEKIWALSPFAVALNFLVEEYAGGKGACPPRKRRHKRSVYIATIEKSLGLLNSLAETGRMNEIGLIVVDELHLLGDGSRGATLEAVITKALFVKEDIHIIGMSATIGNLNEIAEFLKAEIYTRNFRPVELKEYVKCGSDIMAVVPHPVSMDEAFEFTRRCSYEYTDIQNKKDPDQIGGLVMEVIPQSSCLIFCPSKKNCENVALLLCEVLPPSILMHRKEEKSGLKQAILRDCGTLCSVLSQTVSYGVAYHHSGLTSDERKHLEDAFRAGVLCVICCTSTLAAGVNLPAKRVILRSPYVGRNFIHLSKYKQMVGRAGRAGMGETGESILIFSKKDVDRVKTLLCSPMDEACSNLHINNASGLKSIILSAIGLNMAVTRTQLYELIKQTLMSVQSERLNINIKKITDTTISTLFKLGALKVKNSASNKSGIIEMSVIMPPTQLNDEVINNRTQTDVSDNKRVVLSRNTPLVISHLGKAAIRACIDLKKAHTLYEDLVQAQAGLVILDYLHLLYLVTPYEQAELITPNRTVYYSVYVKLEPKQLQTANILGINDLCATRILSGKSLKSVPERVVNRFYVTLMLYDLWNNIAVHVVAEKYQVARGIVQSLMTSAASFSSNVLKFCEELEEFWAFKDLLVTFTQRLQHCCSTELLPLMDLPSVKQGRARQLYNAGYKTLHAIAKSNADNLIQDIEHMNRRVANQLIAAAKLLLLEKVETLREEAEDVLEGLGVK